MMSASVRTAPSLSVGNPSVLFTLKEGTSSGTFDVSPDGKRFLVVVYESVGEENPLKVVLNWTAEISQ